MACSAVTECGPSFLTQCWTVPHSGDINEMEEVGNNMTWPQATLPFIYTPDSPSFQPGESCVHLGNKLALGTDITEKVDLLYHVGFWGSALPACWEGWAWNPHSTVWEGPFGGRGLWPVQRGLLCSESVRAPSFPSPWLSCQQMVLDVDPGQTGSFSVSRNPSCTQSTAVSPWICQVGS